ncbi:MAG: M48 family metallopeptidase [Myxococcota bacterium]
MRYESGLPDDQVNVSEGSAIREAGLLVVGFVVTAFVITAILALSIEAIVPLVPPSLEVRVFGKIADLASEEESEEDGVLEEIEDDRTQRVQALVDRMAVHWTDSPYPGFHVFIMDDPMPNAFALPGGMIGVTSGLLDRIETENELAFILGHELGHFAGRDHLRGLGRGLALSIFWMATGISGDQIESLASSASAFSSRHFDRNQESDADFFGVRLLAAEYGHATGPTAVFERVLVDPEAAEAEEQEDGDRDAREQTPGSLERLAGYLSTHPLGPDRIRALDALIKDEGWASDGPQTAWVATDDGIDPTAQP